MSAPADTDIEAVFARYVANAFNRTNEAEITGATTAQSQTVNAPLSFETETSVEAPKWPNDATIVDSKAVKR